MKSGFKGQVVSPVPGIHTLNVHQVKGLVEPLLSVSDITDRGVGVVFLRDRVIFANDEKKLKEVVESQCTVVTSGPCEGRLYYLDKSNHVRAF